MWRFLNSAVGGSKLYRSTEYIPISFLTENNRNSYCITAEFKVNWGSVTDDDGRIPKDDFMKTGIRMLALKVLENNSKYSFRGWCSGNTKFVFRESVILDFYAKYCPVVVLTVKKEDFLELRDLPELTFDILKPKLVAVSSEDLSTFHYTKLRKYFKEDLGLNPNKHVIKVPTKSFIEMFFKLDYSIMGIHFYNEEYQQSVLNRALENLKSKYCTVTESSTTEEPTTTEESGSLRVVRREVSATSMTQFYFLSNNEAIEVDNTELFEMFDGDPDVPIQVYIQMIGVEERYDGDILMDVDYWNDRGVYITSYEEANQLLESIRGEVEEMVEEDEDDEDDIFNLVDDTPVETTTTWAQDIDNLSVAGSENINNGTLYTMSNSNRIWFPESLVGHNPESPTDAEVVEAYQELVAPNVYGVWGWGESGVRLIPVDEYNSWIFSASTLPDEMVDQNAVDISTVHERVE